MNVQRWAAVLMLACACGLPGCSRDADGDGEVRTGRASDVDKPPISAWDQLRTDMTADQVLALMGHPQDVRIEMLMTYWCYSDRGERGPHVAFDTKTMRVIRWQKL